MSDDQIRELLANQMSRPPAPHPWANVERRARLRDDVPSPARHRAALWVAMAACMIAVVGGLVLAAGSGDRPTATGDAPVAAAPSSPSPTPPAATTPQSTEIVGTDASIIGESITFSDGGIARVNAVRRDAPVRNTLGGLLPDGARSTEIEVEQCIGGDDYQPTLNWQPPEYWLVAERWIGVLDDGTEVEARAGYYMLLESRPGACSRGYVTIATPAGSNVDAVTLSRGTGVGDEPIGRWELSQSRPIESPLQPATVPDAAELGEPLTPALFEIYDVTVLDVVDDATPKPSGRDLRNRLLDEPPGGETGGTSTVEPSDPNRKLVEIRAEVCTDPLAPAPPAGTVYSAPGELMWLIQTTDNYVGNPGGETSNGWDPDAGTDSTPLWYSGLIVDGDIADDVPANGECVEGYVQIDLPADAVPAYAIITTGDGHFREVGRVRLGE